MTTIQQLCLGLAYAIITTVCILEWISGCGTTTGECLILTSLNP